MTSSRSEGVMVIRIQLGEMGDDPVPAEDAPLLEGQPAAPAGEGSGGGDTAAGDVSAAPSSIIGEAVETFVPSVIQAFFIFIFSIIYGKIAHFLTSLENHRTQADYNNHYIVKLFLFQMVNYFTGRKKNPKTLSNRESAREHV